jgi:hypothetical protein
MQALLNSYGGIPASLVIDLVALYLMYYVLYFRRHWRTDMLLSYVAMNIGVFMTMLVLTTVQVQFAVGFGLFAILSIIRIQAGRVTAQEMGYSFLALVLGLINGLGVHLQDSGLAVAMNVVLLLIVLVVDCKPLRDRARHMDVKLEGVYTNEAALVAELESKLGGRVAYYETNEIDLIHGHMVIDVRLQPGEGVVEPPVPKSPKHAEDGAAPAPSSGPASGSEMAAG